MSESTQVIPVFKAGQHPRYATANTKDYKYLVRPEKEGGWGGSLTYIASKYPVCLYKHGHEPTCFGKIEWTEEDNRKAINAAIAAGWQREVILPSQQAESGSAAAPSFDPGGAAKIATLEATVERLTKAIEAMATATVTAPKAGASKRGRPALSKTDKQARHNALVSGEPAA